MNKKIEYKGTDITQKLTVDTNELRGLLSCGRATAVKKRGGDTVRIAVLPLKNNRKG